MKKNKHLLCMDFESWVVSKAINERRLSNEKLRELDDDYTRKSLEFILKLLKKHNQKITFFLVFKLEELFPGLIKRILQDGHEIGWHSYSHPRIFSKEILLDELHKSKNLLKKYHVLGFQAPEIIFFKEGYSLLKKYGFTYSSSIYGNSNKSYQFDSIFEIPVSVSHRRFSPKKEEISFPSSLTINNILKFRIPYGSSYFWSILGKGYYSKKLHDLNAKGEMANLFIHNWQIIPPDSAQYKKEYRVQLSFFSNPLFYPYNINVSKVFNYLISEFTFQRCSDYLYEKTK